MTQKQPTEILQKAVDIWKRIHIRERAEQACQACKVFAKLPVLQKFVTFLESSIKQESSRLLQEQAELAKSILDEITKIDPRVAGLDRTSMLEKITYYYERENPPSATRAWMDDLAPLLCIYEWHMVELLDSTETPLRENALTVFRWSGPTPWRDAVTPGPSSADRT